MTIEKPVSKVVSAEMRVSHESTEHMVEVAEMVAQLEGVTLDRTKQYGVATIGGALRVFDDAFDLGTPEAARRNGADILAVLSGKKSDATHIDPKLDAALKLAADNLTPEARAALMELTRAQIASIQQREKGVSAETVQAVTQAKGEQSVLLLALQVNPHMDVERQKCYKALGYLLQMIDDYRDRVIDTKAGVMTIANSATRPLAVNDIQMQSAHVRSMFEAQYGQGAPNRLFAHLDKVLASAGIL